MIVRIILLSSLYFVHVKPDDHTTWNGKDDGGRVYFYTEPYQSGTGYVLDLGFLGQCFSINKNNPPGLVSLDTNGACVYVFSDPYCAFEGKWTKIRRYQYEANNLNACGLGGQIQSVRSCSAFKIPVYLFTSTNFAGESLRVDVFAKSGCTNVPRNPPELRKRFTQSVYLNDPASCAILFTQLNCRGEGIRVYSASPHSRDMRLVDFVERIRSVQSCAAGHHIHAKYTNSTTSTTPLPAANDDPDAESEYQSAELELISLNHTKIEETENKIPTVPL